MTRRKRYRLHVLGRVLDGDKEQLVQQLRYLARQEFQTNDEGVAERLLDELHEQLLNLGQGLEHSRRTYMNQLAAVHNPYEDLDELVDALVECKVATKGGQVDDPHSRVLQPFWPPRRRTT